MYEKETYEVILERMLGRVSDKLDKRPSSLIYDTHSPAAMELQGLYIELEYLIRNSYGDTAAREFLVLLAKDRGLVPDAATGAVLKGEFEPAGIDVSGRRFNIGNVNYTVLEGMGPGEYKVQCETEGTVGNQHFGDMIPLDYIDGLQSARLTEILIPGEDEEDTEAFRQRYFDSFSGRSFAGNRAAYMEAVKRIDGVGDLKITRVWNGDICPAEMVPTAEVASWYESAVDGLDAGVASWLSAVYTAAREKKLTVGGTVLITVVSALDFGPVSDVLLDRIQTELDPEQNAGEGYGIVPIGHVVSVKSAESVPIYVKAEVTFSEGYGWTATGTLIRNTVDSYLLELRKEWAGSSGITVRISQIESRILGVKGVIDITGTQINGSPDNLTLTAYQIPVTGGVSA